ncbi:MAG: ABC transporter permease [Gemmatimonadales bacterium]|nr:ABC transporter permease [Gemmatimonadales bacterium]
MVGRAGGEPIPLRIGVAAGDLFPVLGVSPVVGRVLDAGDDRVGAAPVAVISEGLWRRRFGADPAVVGKVLPIWTTSHTIVGVIPGDFALPAGAEAWVTLAAIRPEAVTEAAYGTLDFVGRLRPGATPADAKAELDRLLLETSSDAWAADSRLVSVVQPLRDVLLGEVRPALLVLWAAAILVFLVVVLNLGGLLAVRSLERRQEFALRRALGATRTDLVRQLAVESGMFVALGALLGLGVAWAALRLVPAIAPGDLPRMGEIGLRPGVVVVGLGLGLIGTIIASGLPALATGESRPSSHRSSGVPRAGIAVIAQVSLAIVTVATALLLVRTLAQLQRLDPGFDAANLAIVQVATLSPSIETSEQVVTQTRSYLDRVLALPGVSNATAVLNPPFAGTGGFDMGFVAEGQTLSQAAGNPYLNYEPVTPGYFATFRTPIVRGRPLSDADRAGALPVVVLSRGLADRMWPGQDPIGKRIRWADSASAEAWRTVVGVAGDMRYRELREPRPSVYVPLDQQEYPPPFLIVRSGLRLETLLPTLRQVARAVDPDLAVVNASSMSALLARPLAQPRFNAGVLLGFAAVAVLLAAVGLYGLVSFLVTQRTREIGIRLAVGAEPRQILAFFLRRGLVPLAIGCLVGTAIVLAGAELLSSLLFGVTARDPVAIVGAVLGFTLVAIVAILVPARRAAASDPSAALRLE